MSLIATGYEHIVIDKNGVAIIAGTTMKVIELATEKIAYGWSPEEIHFQHPYLSMGQIHSALAYYWDHTEKLDKDIERRMEETEEIRKKTGPSPLVARLKSKGLH